MPRFTKGKSPVRKKTGPHDHEECRAAICGTCLQKDGNLSAITPTVLERIKQFVWQDYSLENSALPKTICFQCCTKLCRLTQVIDILNSINLISIMQNPSAKNSIPKVKYIDFTTPHPTTRQSQDLLCQCSVCCLARASLHQETKALLDRFIENQHILPISPTVKRVCMKCSCEIGRGKPHLCTLSTFRQNTIDCILQTPEKTQGRLTSDLIKNHFEKQGMSTRGGTINLATGGKQVKVTMGVQAADLLMKPKSFSHQNIIDIIGRRNLSDRAAL